MRTSNILTHTLTPCFQLFYFLNRDDDEQYYESDKIKITRFDFTFWYPTWLSTKSHENES